jgi:hypothetical protein
MKKKQRQMIGMLLALVVLAAAFLGIRQYNKNASSATSTTEDTQETVLDVNSDDITSAVWTKKAVNLSLFHTERKMIYGYMVSVFFCKIGYFYHICLPYQLLALTSNNSRYLCQSLFGVLVLLYEANVIKR